MLLWVSNLGFAGGPVTVVVPSVPGLEFTADVNRLHYTARQRRLHFTADVNRLHYTAKKE